jgi:hypothetical protein
MAVQRDPARGIPGWIWFVLIVFLLIALALILPTLIDRGDPVAPAGADATPAPAAALTPAAGAGVGEPGLVTIDDIHREPDLFAGRRVSTHGNVRAVLDDSSFILESHGAAGRPGADLLVIAGPDVALPELATDANVEVAGTVQRFDRAATATEVGRPLEGDVFEQWDGQLAIVADFVNELTDEGARTLPTPGAQTTPAGQ